MREYHLPIAKAFLQGLSPVDKLPVNAEFCEICSGVKVEPYGLRQLDNVPFANIVQQGEFGDDNYFPFPQLVVNTGNAYFVDIDRLYSITSTGNVWRNISVTYASAKVITFVPSEFGPYTTMVSLFTNGQKVHIYDYTTGVDLDLTVNTITQYQVTFVENHGEQGSVVANPYTNSGTATINRLYTYTSINAYDAYIPTNPKSLTSNMRWHVADFGDSWFMFNGACTLFKTNIGLTPENDDYEGKVFVEDDTTIGTGCAFRGRLITGGFNTTDFWNDDWQEVWDLWRDNIIDDFPDMGNLAMEDIGSNFVMWSSVGGDLLFHFYPHIALSGYTNPNIELDFQAPEHYLDFVEKNQMGFMPMPWNGSVLCVKAMDDKVIVYGDTGIAALIPTTLNGSPTFGLKLIANFGIYHRDAVGGSGKEHLFITSNGEMYTLGADLSLTYKGYKEHIASYMLKAHVVISYDELYQDYYVVFSNYADVTPNAFLLSRSGLSKIYHYPNSLYRKDGDLIGVGIVGKTSTIECVTLPFNMNNRGIKTVPIMEVQSKADTGTIKSDIKSRYGNADSFTADNYKNVNKEGHLYVTRSGTEFKACVKIYDGTVVHGGEIDAVTLQWKQSDKRQVRGLRNVN